MNIYYVKHVVNQHNTHLHLKYFWILETEY